MSLSTAIGFPFSGRTAARSRWLGLLLAGLALVPGAGQAVVCPFITYAPIGEHAVGHATQWHAAADGLPVRQVQWWYPAERLANPVAGFHSYGDYQRELLQTRPLAPDEHDPDISQQQLFAATAAEKRGAPAVRYDHLIAATMLAQRNTPPASGDWPLIWVGGDPSFADQLASHGFVVVSTPVVRGTTMDLEQRVMAARLAIEATRERYGLRMSSIGFLGFDDQAVLAARLAGSYPQSTALALIGQWKALDTRDPRRDRKRWLDPAEIRVPTLYISAGTPEPALKQHPLQSPFSTTSRVHFAAIDNVHLQMGLQESCAPRMVADRVVKPLVLVQSQYLLRRKLAEFFAAQAGVDIKPAPLVFLPFDERRREPVEVHDTELAAPLRAPPAAAELARLLGEGGVNALLAAASEQTLQRAPVVWWEQALAQLQLNGTDQQRSALLDAWQRSQPGSLAAAVHRASLIMASGRPAAAEWQQARKLIRKNVDVAPRRQQELVEAIESALKASRH